MRAIALLLAGWALWPSDVHAAEGPTPLVNLCSPYSFDIRVAFAQNDVWMNEPSDVSSHHISWLTVPANGCTLIENRGGPVGVLLFGMTYDGEYEWGNSFDYPADQYFWTEGSEEQDPPGLPICVFANPYQEFRDVRPVVSYYTDAYNRHWYNWQCPSSIGASPYRLVTGWGVRYAEWQGGNQYRVSFGHVPLRKFPRRTAVIYVNGASGDEVRAGEQKAGLEAAVRQYAGAANVQDTFTFGSVFVASSGSGIADFVNAVFQARCTDYGACTDGDPGQATLWYYYRRGELWGPQSTQVIGSRYINAAPWNNNVLASQLLSMIRNYLAEYHRVIVVGHSQGTVLVNAVASQLSAEEAKYVRSVLVGTITASVQLGTYVTLVNDEVINAARSVAPDILPGNVTNSSSREPTNHAFLSSYLGGDQSSAEILRQIGSHLRTMGYPGYPALASTPGEEPAYNQQVSAAIPVLLNQAVGDAIGCLNSGSACPLPTPPTSIVGDLVDQAYDIAQACLEEQEGCPTARPNPDPEAVHDAINQALAIAISLCRQSIGSCEVPSPDTGPVEQLVGEIYLAAQGCLQAAPGCGGEYREMIDGLVAQAVGAAMACLQSQPNCPVPPPPTDPVTDVVNEIFDIARDCIRVTDCSVPDSPVPSDPQALVNQAIAEAVSQCSKLAVCEAIGGLGTVTNVVDQVVAIANACVQHQYACPIPAPPPLDLD